MKYFLPTLTQTPLFEFPSLNGILIVAQQWYLRSTHITKHYPLPTSPLTSPAHSQTRQMPSQASTYQKRLLLGGDAYSVLCATPPLRRCIRAEQHVKKTTTAPINEQIADTKIVHAASP